MCGVGGGGLCGYIFLATIDVVKLSLRYLCGAEVVMVGTDGAWEEPRRLSQSRRKMRLPLGPGMCMGG